MSALARVLSDLKNAGKEIVLVTSGAIGVGVGKLGLGERPHDTPAGRLPPRSVSASLCSSMTSFSANSATRSVSSS